MTEAEKQEIVGLVMTQISSQAVDFDIATEEPQANDLLTAVRQTSSGVYEGVTLKWNDVARIATELANQAATRAEQAKTNVENMKSSVEQTVTDFNALAEEKKQEVQGVYQSDLNELKGDLADVKERVNPITGADEVMQLTYISGYYKDTGEVVDVTWASRTEMIDISGVDAIIFDGAYINFPGGFTVFYKDGVRKYSISEGDLSRATIPYRVDTADYDGVKFSFNNTGLSDIVIKK